MGDHRFHRLRRSWPPIERAIQGVFSPGYSVVLNIQERPRMCSTPNIPMVPERQAMKLPDGGLTGVQTERRDRWRRAIMAGLVTSPQGVLGAPTVGKPTLGGGGGAGNWYGAGAGG